MVKFVLIALLLASNGCLLRQKNDHIQTIQRVQNGDTIIVATIINKDNKKITTWYPKDSNDVKIIEIDSAGKRNGQTNIYSFSGNLVKTIDYRNGLKDGYVTSFYPNGNVREKQQYFMDSICGLSKWYYENGNLQAASIYDFNRKSIYVLKIDPDGSISKEEGVSLSPYSLYFITDTFYWKKNRYLNENPSRNIIHTNQAFWITTIALQYENYQTSIQTNLFVHDRNIDLGNFNSNSIIVKERIIIKDPGLYAIKISGITYNEELNVKFTNTFYDTINVISEH